MNKKLIAFPLSLLLYYILLEVSLCYLPVELSKTLSLCCNANQNIASKIKEESRERLEAKVRARHGILLYS